MCRLISLRKYLLVTGDARFYFWWHPVFVIITLFYAQSCDGHGRLIEPPSRASAWRYGFQTPPDYNDHELYCGGFTRQWKRNDGKCGECGDAWDMPKPRPHEYGGQWGQGVIVRSYMPGTEMTIRVELTASHMGYFEFRLCPEPNGKQDCLDKNLLAILGGTPTQPHPGDLDTRFYPRNGSRIYDIKARLPDLKCDQCLLQWRYVAGNNWGICDDGNGAVGCGPQEEFRSCSDIALTEDARMPAIHPIRPTYRTTLRPKSPKTSTETSTTETEDSSEGFNYIPLLAIFIMFLLLFGVFVAWYFYRSNVPMVTEWLGSAANRFCKKLKRDTKPTRPIQYATPPLVIMSAVQKTSILEEFTQPPVPPPRTKRQSRLKEMSTEESCVS